MKALNQKRSPNKQIKKQDITIDEEIFLGMSTKDEIEQRFQSIAQKTRQKSSGRVTFKAVATSPSSASSKMFQDRVELGSPKFKDNSLQRTIDKRDPPQSQREMSPKYQGFVEQDKNKENKLKQLSQSERKDDPYLKSKIVKIFETNNKDINKLDLESNPIDSVINQLKFQPSSYRGSQLLNSYSVTSSARNSIIQPSSERNSLLQINGIPQNHSHQIQLKNNSQTQRNSQMSNNSIPKIHSARGSNIDTISPNKDKQKVLLSASRHGSNLQMDQQQRPKTSRHESQIQNHLLKNYVQPHRNTKSSKNRARHASQEIIHQQQSARFQQSVIPIQEATMTSQDIKSFDKGRRASLFDMVSVQKAMQKAKCVQTLKQNLAEESQTPYKLSMQYGGSNNKNIELNNSQLENLSQYIYEISIQTQQLILKAGGGCTTTSIDKIFEYFNINKNKLMNLPSGEEKENYIIQSIQNQCAQQLEDLMQGISQKALQFQEMEKKIINKKETHANIGEYFKWIKIPCQYPALKNKLKDAIVEVLYGQDHLSEIQQANKQYKEIEENEKNMNFEITKFNSTSQIQLNKQSDIALRIKEQIKVNKKERADSEYGTQKLKAYQNESEWKEGRRQLIQKAGKSISITESILKAYPEKNQSQFNESNHEISDKLNNFQWDAPVERTFGDYRKNAKRTFVGVCSMNKWQSIGMQPILQMLGLEEKLDLYRELLVQRFREKGKPLNLREKQFLINTSELLNANIDKKEFQEMLEFISIEDIQILEQRISQNILLKYEVVTNQLKDIRNYYLKIKSQQTSQQIKEFDAKGNPLDKIKAEYSINIKRRHMKNLVDRTKIMLEKRKEKIDYLVNLKRNRYVVHFVKQMKKALNFFSSRKTVDTNEKKKENNLKAFAQRNYPNQQKPLFIIKQCNDEVSITVKASQQIFHPNQRVLLGVTDLIKTLEKKQNGETQKITSAQIEKMKILLVQQEMNLKQKQLPKQLPSKQQQNYFKEFYSSGPVDARDFKQSSELNGPSKNGDDEEFPKRAKPHSWINADVKKQAAILIQKWVRGRLSMIQFKFMKEELENFQEKVIFEKLKKRKDERAVFQFALEQGKKMLLAKQKSLKRMNTLKSLGSENKIPGSFKSEIAIKEQTSGQLNDPNKSEMFSVQEQPYKIQKNSSTENLLDHNHSISSINSKMSSKNSISPQKKISQISQPSINVPQGRSNMKQHSMDDLLGTGSRSTGEFHSVQFTGKKDGSCVSTHFDGISTPNSENFSIKRDGESKRGEFQKNVNQRISEIIERQEDNQIHSHPKETSSSKTDERDKTDSTKKGVFRQKNKEDFLLKQKRLFFAVKQGSLATLFNSGFVYYPKDFNVRDELFNTPLYYVTKRGDNQFIQYLLKGGADVNIRCNENNSVLHAAFEAGNVDIIISLIDNGGDLNYINNQGMTPLAVGKIEVLKQLGLEKGVTNVLNENSQQIETIFDNNELFNQTHNVVPEEVKEFNNSPLSLRKKRDMKRPEDEMKQQSIGYEFVQKLTYSGSNEETEKKRIKITREISSNKIKIPFVESFQPLKIPQ